MTSKKIKLTYVLMEEMITDDLIKALTHVKFYRFVDQIKMT